MEIQPSNAIVVVKIKQHTLKILKLFDFQMQITRSIQLYNVIVFQCYSLYFNTLFPRYT